ncbi:YheC/YheD family protein [Ammoniphilus sp. YIM 78166]|uniref:YheC/YheD family protein n=1 Tax=Ammoniphilus sp. YIM 78166 TaxID=1644106 RepID=UPI00143135E4|nr:YheC/YheD family protein [Ammoniphilus sp. YIM 78166]
MQRKINKSKWTKHALFQQDPQIAGSLPDTRVFNEQNFLSMLQLHKTIVLKPTGGAKGRGIIKVAALGKQALEIHYNDMKVIVNGVQKAYDKISQKIGTTAYIIQRYITLATVEDRPIDFRVMVQRTKETPWQVTGKVAKIAGVGYFVTNNCQSNGTAVPVEEAVERSNINPSKKETVIERMETLAIKAVQLLERYYPEIVIIGFDIGVDESGGLWLIEANVYPGLSLFRKLEDKTMLRRILEIKRQNSTMKPLTKKSIKKTR